MDIFTPSLTELFTFDPFTFDPFSFEIDTDIFEEKETLCIEQLPLYTEQPLMNNSIDSDIFLIDSLLSYEQFSYKLKSKDGENIRLFYHVSQTKICKVYVRYVGDDIVVNTDKIFVRFPENSNSIDISFRNPTLIGSFKVFVVIESDDYIKEIKMKSFFHNGNTEEILDEIKVFTHVNTIKNINSSKLSVKKPSINKKITKRK